MYYYGKQTSDLGIMEYNVTNKPVAAPAAKPVVASVSVAPPTKPIISSLTWQPLKKNEETNGHTASADHEFLDVIF
jgi:hypothetical protein